MKCARCSCTESKVIDTRPSDDFTSIRRRRECLECGYRFTTYERIEQRALMVVKKDGTLEGYDRSKIINGVARACEKRPVSTAQLEEMANQIETALYAQAKTEVTSAEIGEMVMEKLRELDEIAYVRFASVYKHFKDIDTFMKELSGLLNERVNDNE